MPINPNIRKYKNDLGLDNVNLDAMFNTPTVPTLDQVTRLNFLDRLTEGSLLTTGTSNFLDERPYNTLHDYNSYNYIWTLYSLSNDQLSDSSSYVGKVFSNNAYWGRENQNFYTVLRSGGYDRSGAISSVGFYDQVFGGTGDDDGADVTVKAQEAAAAEGIAGYGGFKSGANKNKDLFIENVQIENFMGNSPDGVGNLAKGSFTVTEPYGVGGFYEELLNAAKFAGHENYQAAPFLLTLSFIGRKVNKDNPEIVNKGTRYWPIMIRNSKMKVTESGSTYSVQFAGVNYQAARGFNALTREQIPGPDYLTPTVGRLLLYVFQKHNEKVEEIMQETSGQSEGYQGSAESQEAAITQARTVAVSQGGTNFDNNIAPWQPDRYCVWFPKSYGTSEETGFDTDGSTDIPGTADEENLIEAEQFSTGGGEDFPSELKDITYDGWVTYRDANLRPLDNSTFDAAPTEAQSESVGDSGTVVPLDIYSNYISSSKMKDELISSTGIYYIPDLEGPINAANDRIQETSQQYRDKQRELNAFRSEKEVLEQELNALRDDLKVDGVFDVNLLSPTDQELYDSRTNELNNLQSQIGSAEAELETLRVSLEELQRNRNTAEQAQPVRLFGKNRQSWSFKKGITLENIIHQVVLDSTYAKNTFAQEEKWSKILENGMIPWYRVEKFAKIVGFDTARNAPVYEYHYVVCPFQVHYSRLPGANAPLKYDYLKKTAVREYNYIFTGKNLDIMSFDIDYNNLFFVPIDFRKQNAKKTNPNNSQPVAETMDPFEDVRSGVANYIGAEQNQPADATNTDMGSGKAVTNAGATARALHDRMYNNTSDLLTGQLEIIGDPVYLVSSGIANRPKISSFRKQETSLGEVNTFDREVSIVLNIAYPGTEEDSGDIPSSADLAAGKYAMPIKRSRYSGLYRVTKVMSRFDSGQFIQSLQLARYPNQEEDYEEKLEVREPKFVEKVDPKSAPSPQEEIDKAVKQPEVQLDAVSAANLENQGGFGGTENLTKLGSVAVGGLAGFALGGPLGAVFGAAVGGNTNFLQSITDAIGSGTAIPEPTSAGEAETVARAAETTTQSSNVTLTPTGTTTATPTQE